MEFLRYTAIFIPLYFFAESLTQFHQDDYKIIFDRVEILWYNKSIVENLKVYFFRYNRTLPTKLLNASGNLKVDLFKPRFRSQTYKFSSNEYRLFPIVMDMDICSNLLSNRFGTDNLWNHTNAKRACPISKGNYYLSNYMVDQSKLPPHAPRGMYMAEITLYYNDVINITRVRIYGTVEDKMHWFK